MSNIVENGDIGGNSPDRELNGRNSPDRELNGGNSPEVIPKQATMTPSSAVRKMSLKDTPKARSSMKRESSNSQSSAFSIDSDEDEDQENVAPPAKIKKDEKEEKLLKWERDVADCTTSLSDITMMTLNIEMPITLLVIYPVAPRYGQNMQRLSMCDRLGTIVPVRFVGFDGLLPRLQRGEALEISQAKVREVEERFKHAVLTHLFEVVVSKDAEVTIITGVKSALYDVPKKQSLEKLKVGDYKCIANVAVEGCDTIPSTANKKAYAKLKVRDSLGVSGVIYFNNLEANYTEHISIGKVYHMYGLKISTTRSISANIQFACVEVGGNAAVDVEPKKGEGDGEKEPVTTTLKEIDANRVRFINTNVEITGRIWSRISKGRSILVDGHKWGEHVVSLGLMDLPDSMAYGKGDEVSVSGLLTTMNGSFVIKKTAVYPPPLNSKTPTQDELSCSPILPLTTSVDARSKATEIASSLAMPPE